MTYYAIPKALLPVISVDFTVPVHELRNTRMINALHNFDKEEFLVLHAANEDMLVFRNLSAAKTVAVFMSRIYSDNSQLVACEIKQFATAVILEFPGSLDYGEQFQSIDAHTLANYVDFSSIPFYQFETLEMESTYFRKVLAEYKQSSQTLPKCTKRSIQDEQPIAAYYQNASAEFKTKPLAPAVVLPFRPSLRR